MKKTPCVKPKNNPGFWEFFFGREKNLRDFPKKNIKGPKNQFLRGRKKLGTPQENTPIGEKNLGKK